MKNVKISSVLCVIGIIVVGSAMINHLRKGEKEQ